MKVPNDEVVLIRPGWPHVLPAFLAWLSGKSVWTVGPSPKHQVLQRILTFVGCKAIDIEDDGLLELPEHGYNTVGELALRVLDSWKIEVTRAGHGEVDEEKERQIELLSALLLKSMNLRSPDITPLIIWMSNREKVRYTVHSMFLWDAFLLRQFNVSIRASDTLPKVDVALKAVRGFLIRGRLRLRTVGHRNDQQGVARPWDRRDVAALVIFNRGMTYGDLYSYDFFFAGESESDVKESDVYYLGNEILPNREERSALIQKSLLARGYSLPSVVRRYRNRCNEESSCPRAVTLWTALALERAENVQHFLAAYAPHVRVAILTFDWPVPVELIIGCWLGGIKTLAVTERKSAGCVPSWPLAVDVYLTASEDHSSALRQSRVAFVSCLRPVGLWRTDLLLGNPHDSLDVQDSIAGGIVLVLPYDVSDTAGSGLTRPHLSAKGVRTFLEDILMLVQKYPRTTFVFRGKTGDWSQNQHLRQVVASLSHRQNVIFDQVSQLNRTYILARNARFAVGKYSSIMDELEAVGTPCIVHDFCDQIQGEALSLTQKRSTTYWTFNQSDFFLAAERLHRIHKAAPDRKWPDDGMSRGSYWADTSVRSRIRMELASLAREKHTRSE